MARPTHVTLVSRDYGPLRNGLGLLAAAVIVPLAIVVKLLVLPFERPAKSSPAGVAASLRNFLDETDGLRGWDEFTSVPLADSRLESIRRRAAEVSLPLTAAGRAEIERLLAEAEHLPAQKFRED